MSQELDAVLEAIGKGKDGPFYLLVGEEFLVRKGADELVKKLVPDAAMGLNFATLDGGSPREIAQELLTLPMFPGRKVVLARDPEFLAPKKGRADGLSKARDAWRANRRKEGARRVLALAARAGWGAGQLDPSSPGAPSVEDWREELGVELAEADVAFLREVSVFCREEGITAPESDASPLLDAFTKGLPRGHALVVATSDVDARNALVKWAHEHGVVIEKKVASRLKDLDLRELAQEVLEPFGKQLSADAEQLLKERCGGNMRLVQSELEKLALYVEGTTIKPADVEALVARAREEQFMELSEALQQRNLQAALRYVYDAVEVHQAHPLLLLGAIASITRNLIESHERAAHMLGGAPMPKSSREFEAKIFPKVAEEAKARKAKVPHPYAAFMSMSAAMKFSRKQLLDALVACADVDLALKSGGGADGRTVIERLLWTVCGAAERRA
jgi:DNA polymerase-3 subunit delta